MGAFEETEETTVTSINILSNKKFKFIQDKRLVLKNKMNQNIKNGTLYDKRQLWFRFTNPALFLFSKNFI